MNSRQPRTPLSASRRPASRSSFVENLRNQSINRTADILEECGEYFVQTFGPELPVVLTGAIAMAESNAQISCRMHSSGYGWLVVSRLLYVWRFKHSSQNRNMIGHCIELKLPQSEIGHKADLICVFATPGSSSTHLGNLSAVVLSPEGFVRYWPSIGQDTNYVEVTVSDLNGQECCSLTDVQPLGFLLSTTTSTLAMITPTLMGNGHIINVRMLRTSQGILAGFSRKLTYMLGQTSSHSSEIKLHRVIGGPLQQVGSVQERSIYVLTGKHLQKWVSTTESADRLVYECDLEAPFREKLNSIIHRQTNSTVFNTFTVRLIDMHSIRNHLIVLGAALGSTKSIHYAIGVLNSNDIVDKVSSDNFAKFILLDDNQAPFEEGDILPYEIIATAYAGSNYGRAFVYNQREIICVSLDDESEQSRTLGIKEKGSKILGSGSCEGKPLFFSSVDGLFAINYASGAQEQSTFNESSFLSPSLSESFSGQVLPSPALRPQPAPIQNGASFESGDVVEQVSALLQDALVNYLRRDPIAVTNFQSAMQQVLGLSQFGPPALLDGSVVRASQELMDGVSKDDPRWAESGTASSGSDLSVILLKQLETKKRNLQMFVAMLKQTELWDRLTSVDAGMSTKYALIENIQRLDAAIALRRVQDSHGRLFDVVIREVVQGRNQAPAGKITYQDIFYKEVSRIENFISQLIAHEESVIATLDAGSALVLVIAVNDILVGIIKAVYDGKNKEGLEAADLHPDFEYVPWYCSDGLGGLREAFTTQHAIVVEYGIKNVKDAVSRSSLFHDLTTLSDIILDSFVSQLDGLQCCRQTAAIGEKYTAIAQLYEAERHRFCSILYENEQIERAAGLAEKYFDFLMLVRICREMENNERLQHYVGVFAERNFAQFAFKYYIDNGESSQLLRHPVLSKLPQLSKFLEDYPTIKWLQEVNVDDYNAATETLENLAFCETESLQRKKTQLSLEKLCLIMADEQDDVKKMKLDRINLDLEVVLCQERLPAQVLETCGIDAKAMPVISIEQLIELFIGDENLNANENDFKMALDLFKIRKQLNDTTDDSILKHIWCRAILRDCWLDCNTNDVGAYIKDTIFVRTIDLSFMQGTNLREILPRSEDLLDCAELAGLKGDDGFEYTIKYAYEQIKPFMELEG